MKCSVKAVGPNSKKPPEKCVNVALIENRI